MSFATWLIGILEDVLAAFLPFLRSELARMAADPAMQALAKKAITVAAMYAQNTGDERFDIAVRGLRQDCKDMGKDLALGWASTIIQAAFERAKAEDPISIHKS